MKTLMTTPAVWRTFTTKKDDYNNTVRDEAADTEVMCWVTTRRAGIDAENNLDRTQIKQVYTLFFDGNYGIIGSDQIIIESEYSGTENQLVLEVFGEPQRLRDRQGNIRHLEVICEVIKG